jgi:hypothetical protein
VTSFHPTSHSTVITSLHADDRFVVLADSQGQLWVRSAHTGRLLYSLNQINPLEAQHMSINMKISSSSPTSPEFSLEKSKIPPAPKNSPVGNKSPLMNLIEERGAVKFLMRVGKWVICVRNKKNTVSLNLDPTNKQSVSHDDAINRHVTFDGRAKDVSSGETTIPIHSQNEDSNSSTQLIATSGNMSRSLSHDSNLSDAKMLENSQKFPVSASTSNLNTLIHNNKNTYYQFGDRKIHLNSITGNFLENSPDMTGCIEAWNLKHEEAKLPAHTHFVDGNVEEISIDAEQKIIYFIVQKEKFLKSIVHKKKDEKIIQQEFWSWAPKWKGEKKNLSTIFTCLLF